MDGFINIKKPKGFTSHDVVNIMKRSFRKTKIGHGGTLDPEATGVLPICIGKATKLQDYVMGQKKVYRTEIAFGYDSPTLDSDGDYVVIDDHFSLSEDKLNLVLKEFIGEIEQIPPMVSAIKKDGVPLYKLAQRGVELPRDPRQVTIYDIHIEDVRTEAPFPRVFLTITCSKGTYIRSLARDIGVAMGTKAIVWNLERVSTGSFLLEDSYTMEEVANFVSLGNYSFLLPMDKMIEDMEKVVPKDMADIRGVLAGNALGNKSDLESGTTVKITDHNDMLLALGNVEDDGSVKPFKILYEKRKRKKDMEIISSWKSLRENRPPTAVALGNFDGVHSGHRYLLETMAIKAEQESLQSLVATLSPHPSEFFGSSDHKYLLSKKDKILHIGDTGVDTMLFMPFDESFAEMDPEAFVDDVLIGKLNANHVYVGYNFKFGKNALGDVAFLGDYLKKHSIELTILDKITYDGMDVSSSKIRDELKEGEITKVNQLLGYTYHLDGEVVYGQQLGRVLGFPTANVDFSRSVRLPAAGIYTTWAKYRGKRHPSVTNIGVRPTVGDDLALTVEVHILDDSPDLYGELLEVSFLNRIRGEERFDSLDMLKEKIAEDAEIARSFFSYRQQKKK